jgi:hypothetical protein
MYEFILPVSYEFIIDEYYEFICIRFKKMATDGEGGAVDG